MCFGAHGLFVVCLGTVKHHESAGVPRSFGGLCGLFLSLMTASCVQSSLSPFARYTLDKRISILRVSETSARFKSAHPLLAAIYKTKIYTNMNKFTTSQSPRDVAADRQVTSAEGDGSIGSRDFFLRPFFLPVRRRIPTVFHNLQSAQNISVVHNKIVCQRMFLLFPLTPVLPLHAIVPPPFYPVLSERVDVSLDCTVQSNVGNHRQTLLHGTSADRAYR